jgi:hypothetical protein
MCGCNGKGRGPEPNVLRQRSYNFDSKGRELPHPAGCRLLPGPRQRIRVRGRATAVDSFDHE